MIDAVTVMYNGKARRAIYAIPPRFVTWSGTRARLSAIAPLTMPVLLPDGCRVRALPWWLRWLGVPAMFGINGVMYINPERPYLLTETVVHELVHWMQRRRMRPSGYEFTYLWQWLLAIVKRGRWHDVHIMEAEARRIAREIMDERLFALDGEVLDAPTLIEARLAAT